MAETPGAGEKRGKEVQVRLNEEMAGGVYSNSMMVQHTREEFIMDFAMVLRGKGSIVARVVTSPGHLKRIVVALQDNLTRYEKIYGPIRHPGDIHVEPGPGFTTDPHGQE
jgi:hypothetical protein